jgi:hypothetical protein
MRIYYAYNVPYEKGKNKPYNRPQSKAKRRAPSQEERIKFIRFHHNAAREGAG